MANVLVVYCQYSYPPRATVLDHLYCFERYSSHRCFYLNLALRDVPSDLLTVQFDLIVYHTTFLAWRWGMGEFHEVVHKARKLKPIAAVRVAMPQDEFYETDALEAFIDEFAIDVVFSVGAPDTWPVLYPNVDTSRVRFERVLTGYLDDFTIGRIDRLLTRRAPRVIDIGYRAWPANAWLGRRGYLKSELAHVFGQRAPIAGLSTDISIRPQDTFLGDDWYRFLLRCRYVVGVEGGSAVMDRDGTLRKRAEAFVQARPAATFEEIESACFPGRDGEVNYFALSPRHLEACATFSCQVLITGSYGEALTANVHYLPLAEDFGNLDEILRTLRDDEARSMIVGNAYRDIVASRAYSYRRLVEQVTGLVSRSPHAQRTITRQELRVLARMQRDDQLAWGKAALMAWFVAPVKRRARAHLPAELLRRIKDTVRGARA